MKLGQRRFILYILNVLTYLFFQGYCCVVVKEVFAQQLAAKLLFNEMMLFL
jgi:hypothetical protein